jgi:Tfp pilus assembly protein PilN
MKQGVVSTSVMPLFGWPEQREIDALQCQRNVLAARIAKLPRFSHRRIELEARLRALTEQQLQISNGIKHAR